MASRGENIDRDLRTLIQTETGKKGIGHAIARAGMAPVQFMDHVMSFPLWHAVYQDSLKENVNLPEDTAQYRAMQKADGAVRMGLGSNAPKDLPPIHAEQRLHEADHNARRIPQSEVEPDERPGQRGAQRRRPRKLTYGMLMAAVIPAVLGQLVTGHGPKDDENAGLWAAKRALLFPAETVPCWATSLRAWKGKATSAFRRCREWLNARLRPELTQRPTATTRTGRASGWTACSRPWMPSRRRHGPGGENNPLRTQASNGEIDSPNVWDAVAGSARK